MRARFHSWGKQIKRLIAILVFAAILIVLIKLILIGYGYDWTGFNVYTITIKSNATGGTTLPTNITVYQPSKTLYDWLQLLIIPVGLAVAALLFDLANSRTEHKVSLDKQRQDLLQAYIDKISELLLKDHLGERTEDGKLKREYDQVRNIARVRTITVLTQLDSRRVGHAFSFLREAKLNLSTPESSVMSLAHAPLSRMQWGGANLYCADLSHANLSHADLRGADLRGANLACADLRGANLRGAKLTWADLSEAKVIEKQLIKAKSRKGATMPDGKMYRYSSGVDLSRRDLKERDLSERDLSKANLSEANLSKADLSRAYLSGADLTGAHLEEAKLRGIIGITREELEKQTHFLKGATMPDGKTHP